MLQCPKDAAVGGVVVPVDESGLWCVSMLLCVTFNVAKRDVCAC